MSSHHWNYDGGRAADQSLKDAMDLLDPVGACDLEPDDENCTQSVFPDRWKIDGRFFQVNAFTPQSINDTLRAMFIPDDERSSRSIVIPKVLAAYETGQPDDWEDEAA